MAEKYFNRREAEKLLPMIEPWLEEARIRKQRIEALDKALSQAAARIMALGGSRPPYAELAKKRTERDQCATQVKQAVAQIQETGCLVKDLDEGLIDFPSLREGEEVYLCWKLGEGRIEYWHGIHEGFARRKPLGKAEPPAEPPAGKGRVQ